MLPKRLEVLTMRHGELSNPKLMANGKGANTGQCIRTGRNTYPSQITKMIAAVKQNEQDMKKLK